MKKLGFISTNDMMTATLVNPKTRDSRVFSCYLQYIDMSNAILTNHFNVTRKGLLCEVAYPEVLVKISTKTPITFNQFIDSDMVHMQIFNTLVDNDASIESLLKYVCDICNIKQVNVFNSEIYKHYVETYKDSEYMITNLQTAVRSKFLHIPNELVHLLGIDYKYHWIFIY